MYCPYCSVQLPEELEGDVPEGSGGRRPLRALSCPGCQAAIQLDDRRGLFPVTAPIITILIVYRE